MKDRVAEEAIYVRVPKGTRARLEAVRGKERQSDWTRRAILAALDAAEQPAAPAPKRAAGKAKEGA